MNATVRLDIKRGLPPDGEPGQYLGFDVHGNVYVLKWLPERHSWGGAGFDPKFEDKGFMFVTSGSMESFIVAHAPTPLTNAVDEALRLRQGNRKTRRALQATAS